MVLRVHVGTHSFDLSKGSQFVLEENTISEYTLALLLLTDHANKADEVLLLVVHGKVITTALTAITYYNSLLHDDVV
mgnify:CR=1 FL=1